LNIKKEIQPIQIIELTEEESKLYKKLLQKSKIPGSWVKDNLSDVMLKLFSMIYQRNAIPEIRMQIFSNPEYAEYGKKPLKQVFEENLENDQNMIRSPDFLKYLKYFISGPDLPKEFIAKFCDCVERDYQFGSDFTYYFLKKLRRNVRDFNLSKHQRSTEVFRLALEIGFNKEESMIIRKNSINA
jgi:hypothetical protein